MTTLNFTYKFLNCKLEYIPNDVSISIESYLMDSNNQVYINPNTFVLDTFTVQLYKSSLPSSNYSSYISVMAGNAISTKYNISSSGFTVINSNIITQLASTSSLLPGLKVIGDNIPTDTIITSIRDLTSIGVSQNATATGTTTISFSSNGWNIDYSAINELINIINFGSL